ncbi:MAG: hypothetical protein RL662_9 [Bacteroidota bacterium]|jgi:hypothetical protein
MDNKKVTKSIIDLESVYKQANDLFSDIKAEVIAASLIEQGYEQDRIFITRDGASKRGWKKDVAELQVQYSQFDLKDYLYIKSNRGSIYDILPEGLFHSTTNSKKLNRDKEDIINDIRYHRKEEFFARRFFQLFEVQMDSVSINAYLQEAKYDKKVSNPDFVNLFTSLWSIIKLLKREQAIFFLHTIPLLNKIRNQYDEIAQAMSLILDAPVNIKQVKIQHNDVGNEIQSELGTNRLGIDWILGRSFDDGLFDLKVSIGPISSEEMRNYLGNSNGCIILDYLCKLFLPGNMFVIKDYIIEQKQAVFKLTDSEHISYLGINTFL